MTTQARTKGWEKDSKINADYEYERLIKLENKFNIKPWLSKGKKEGYLYNIVPTTLNVVVNSSNKFQKKTGVHMYFVSDNNKTWRLTLFYRPYFYMKTKNIHNYEAVAKYLKKELDKNNVEIDYVKKEDLSLYDHLNKKRSYLSNIFFKLSFDTIENLMNARDFLSKIIEKNKKNKKHNNSSNNDKHIFNECEYELSQSKLEFSYKHDFSYTKYDEQEDSGWAKKSHDAVSSSPSGHRVDKEKQNDQKKGNIVTNSADKERDSKKNDAHATMSNQKLNMNEIVVNTKRQILSKEEIMDEIVEIYEYDVKYITRICIDKNIRCGVWYKVTRDEEELYTESIHFEILNKKVLAPLNVLAWDIECYKDELKFPDKEKDEIILISYMYNAQGYLIVNRNVMSKNITEFLYKPNEEYSGAGTFKIFNEQNEYFLLKRFLEHIKILKIHIFVTYNGDFFDIPYLCRRCEINNLSVPKEIGFIMNNNKQECSCNFILNIDAYKWVERDSYLPNGSRTLKSVCKIKLKYNPTEVDPEQMVPIARKNPQHLAVYSVSDAVATFYLYDKFIHNFLFALCSIIPMNPDNVLRQGSGTLCEQLLMAEAYKKNILFPNKSKPVYNQYFTDFENKKKYFIYDDSFVGGTVQSLKCGIYRDDLKEYFNLDVDAYKHMLNNIDSIIDFWIHKDLNKNNSVNDNKYINKNQIINLKKIKSDIINKLNFFIQNPKINTCPNIYHLDVAAMYPNIILSHRLQPNAIITPDHCFNCSFYKQRHLCQKQMVWKRKLEISPIDYGHVLSLKQDLKTRLFYPQKSYFKTNNNEDSDKSTNDNLLDVPISKKKSWNELTEKQQHEELMKVIKDCSQKVFKKTKVAKEVDAASLVCQRENPFYVDTVRTFRDRRYVYKKALKECEHEKKELLKAKKIDYIKIQELDDKILLNDSLQLAHKCILNSFYGYVKRKSSRWYSDQMGAIVTYTGSQIINGAFNLINKIGIPMELDTDGIWCMLPKQFPEIYEVLILEKNELNRLKEYENKSEEELKNDSNVRKVEFEFPTNILNFQVHKKWTNDQYLVYNENTDDYECISKNEIFFELDGPWHGMFLPASEKSDDLLKKRYVVFNDKYKISELKGFEIKRRGELRIIQKFQSEIFNHFLKGKTKEESYYYASLTANKWKNLIDTKAVDIDNDDELFDLILSKKVLNKSVKEQPNAKSFGITTAKRLSELLSNSSYVEDNNVSTQFIVASKPIGSDITFRAIPIQIFKTNVETQIHYLGKWLGVKLPPNVPVNVRDIIDWDYYKQKLEVQILKLVIIPAIKQNINNPITSISVPEWLKKQINISEGKQKKITAFFVKKNLKKECVSNENDSSITPTKEILNTDLHPKAETATEEEDITWKKDDPSKRSLEKKSPFQVKEDETCTAPSSLSNATNPKKRSIEQVLLENLISKRKKLGQLNKSNLDHSNSGSMVYKKVNSLDAYLEKNNNIIIINHEKININNLKYTELLEMFETDFKKWIQINNAIWKNNRSQIKKIRNEGKFKRKKYSLQDERNEKEKKNNGATSGANVGAHFGAYIGDDDEKTNSQKMSNLEPKYLHVIQNDMDIVYLYKKVKKKKTTSHFKKGKNIGTNASFTSGGMNSYSPMNNNSKSDKHTLLKPYLKYFKHETDSDSSNDENDIFNDTNNVLDENDDDGIYYAIVSLKNMNKFYKIKIQVYRHIYINNYDPLDIKSNSKITINLVSSSGLSGSSNNENFIFHSNAFANCFLPRNVKIFNLYEFIMSEKYFNRYVVNTLNANYHESIVSVYETKIPLYFDFLSRYGNSVEIDSTNYNSIFDENKCFKSHCFSKVEKNKIKNVSQDYLDDIHIIHIHIFHTLIDTVCNRIFISVYDQFEENSDDLSIGNKIMFSGIPSDKNFDPYETFIKFLQLQEHYAHFKDNITFDTNANGIFTNNTTSGNFFTKNKDIHNDQSKLFYTDQIEETNKKQILDHLFDKNFFIKNVQRDLLFLYHYRKFDTYYESNSNVYKVLEYLDLYLNKYRNNMLSGKKKYIFYVSSTIDKKKLGWWSTGKYFPCYFKKFENSGKYQNISRVSYKQDAFNLSLQLFFENYHKVEEDLNFSRISNIPLFNLLNVNKKNQKHKFIYDILYASFLKKYKGILWLSYFGNYDLGIPCLNINNFCDYDLVKKNSDIINQGIYRGYIVHLFFNESLIFNSVRLFTKYANANSSKEYYNPTISGKNSHMKKNYHKRVQNGDMVKNRHPMKHTKNSVRKNVEEDLDADDMSTTDDNNSKIGTYGNRKGREGSVSENLDRGTKKNDFYDDNEMQENNGLSDFSEKKNLIKNKYDINSIVEQNSHVSQFSNFAFKLLGQSLEYLISKISSLSMLITNKTFESISDIFTSFYFWVSSNSSLLYDVALYNKVLECSEIYQNNLINIMKKKFNANIIFADLRNLVISFNEFSVISGRNILKNLIKYFSHSDSIYANVPFYIKQEYIAACQFDKYNFIRYKEYSNPNEENTDENLKIIEYLPPICESFLRYVLDVITLNPLQDIVALYEKWNHHNNKQSEAENKLTLSSEPAKMDEQNNNEASKPNQTNMKDEKNYFNIILKTDKLTDKINLAQRAQLKYIYDNSFDDLGEVCESFALINENVDVLSYKIEEKLKDLWFMPGIIYKKIKKSIKYKKYLVENYWPYDDDDDEIDENNMSMVPFLFPKTLGNLAKRESNWKLEIVKFCIFLMENDKLLNLENENCNEAFHEKRHELFEIIGDCEYNRKNSHWKSPCQELILKDIFCENCSSVYHMNVVTSLVEAEINGKASFIWLCKNCNSKYDNEFIELKILSLLQETFDAYNAQDLVCKNCNSIKSFYRRAICKCGQTFMPRLDIANWTRTLEIMENLATMLNMPILLDALKSMKTYLV